VAGILVHTDSGLGIITLDDPAGGNRLNPPVLAALQEALRRLSIDVAVRAILLRSSGSAFCLGMDLAGLAAAGEEARKEGIDEAVAAYVSLLSGIHEAPKPVIALLAGPVKAGGVGLVSACDVVVASEESTFELGEAFFGIIPANVLPFLFGVRLPLQKVRYLILTGRTLSGADARGIGLVDELYPAAELERGARELVRRMWRTSPAAVAEAKAFTRALLDLGFEEAKVRAREKLAGLLGGGEVMAAIRAFNDGGVPPWFGKWRPSAPLVLHAEAGSPGGAR
jgi:enoyl-CoA hydratase/carnithine racemase